MLIHDKCEQEDTINSISRTLERMEKSQDRLVELLEKVSNQEARLDHLEDNGERTYSELNDLFARIRTLEISTPAILPNARQQFHDSLEVVSKKLDKLNRFFTLVTSKPATVIYGAIVAMIISGTILDVMYHFESLKAIYHLFK